MVFGANLMKEFQNIRFLHPELSYNFSNFVDRCIFSAIYVIGKITPEQIFNSDNLLKDIKNAFPRNGLIGMSFLHNGVQSTVSCGEALQIIEGHINSDVQKTMSHYANSIFGQAGGDALQNNDNKLFKKNLETVLGGYLGVKSSAEDTLKQIMLMHGASSFGRVKAMWQQENSWSIAGELSGHYLPMLLEVLKCIIYMAFIFVIPMTVIYGTFKFFGNYLMFVASFQLWAHLYSVINMIISLYTYKTSSHYGVISYATFSDIGVNADKITAIAGAMSLQYSLKRQSIDKV
jgi:hypothetical protein